MKTAIQILLVTLIFGGISGGASWLWQKHQSELHQAIQRANAAESKLTENPLAGLEKVAHEPEPPAEPIVEKPEAPVAVRPAYVEGVDESSRLVVSLNQRLRATHDKERRLDERQEALKLIFSDIRTEQAAINKLRQEVSHELDKSSKSVREAMKTAQDERNLLHQELDSLRSASPKVDSIKDNESPPKELPDLPSASPKANSTEPTSDKTSTTSPTTKIEVDPAILKRLGTIYDSMPAEVVAEVFQQLAKNGQDQDMIQLLRNMKDRQAAKVLSTIAATDAAMAASLTEKLKRP